MRLMLGNGTEPGLLVEVDDSYDPALFEFYVINGAWYGKFTNGYLTVLGCPGGAFSVLKLTEIICDNQDRLRGHYDGVFENFANPNYIAAKPKKVEYRDMNDDIPF